MHDNRNITSASARLGLIAWAFMLTFVPPSHGEEPRGLGTFSWTVRFRVGGTDILKSVFVDSFDSTGKALTLMETDEERRMRALLNAGVYRRLHPVFSRQNCVGFVTELSSWGGGTTVRNWEAEFKLDAGTFCSSVLQHGQAIEQDQVQRGDIVGFVRKISKRCEHVAYMEAPDRLLSKDNVDGRFRIWRSLPAAEELKDKFFDQHYEPKYWRLPLQAFYSFDLYSERDATPSARLDWKILGATQSEAHLTPVSPEAHQQWSKIGLDNPLVLPMTETAKSTFAFDGKALKSLSQKISAVSPQFDADIKSMTLDASAEHVVLAADVDFEIDWNGQVQKKSEVRRIIGKPTPP